MQLPGFDSHRGRHSGGDSEYVLRSVRVCSAGARQVREPGPEHAHRTGRCRGGLLHYEELPDSGTHEPAVSGGGLQPRESPEFPGAQQCDASDLQPGGAVVLDIGCSDIDNHQLAADSVWTETGLLDLGQFLTSRISPHRMM